MHTISKVYEKELNHFFLYMAVCKYQYYDSMLCSETVQLSWLNKSTLTETQHQTGLHNCLTAVISNGDDSRYVI